jgi:hypothetical protein
LRAELRGVAVADADCFAAIFAQLFAGPKVVVIDAVVVRLVIDKGDQRCALRSLAGDGTVIHAIPLAIQRDPSRLASVGRMVAVDKLAVGQPAVLGQLLRIAAESDEVVVVVGVVKANAAHDQMPAADP